MTSRALRRPAPSGTYVIAAAAPHEGSEAIFEFEVEYIR